MPAEPPTTILSSKSFCWTLQLYLFWFLLYVREVVGMYYLQLCLSSCLGGSGSCPMWPLPMIPVWGPSSPGLVPQNMFRIKFVHYKTRTVGKLAVGILLECSLVLKVQMFTSCTGTGLTGSRDRTAVKGSPAPVSSTTTNSRPRVSTTSRRIHKNAILLTSPTLATRLLLLGYRSYVSSTRRTWSTCPISSSIGRLCTDPGYNPVVTFPTVTVRIHWTLFLDDLLLYIFKIVRFNIVIEYQFLLNKCDSFFYQTFFKFHNFYLKKL